MKYMHQYSSFLNFAEAEKIANKVLDLENYFEHYSNKKFSILGAASYANEKSQYDLILNKTKGILEKEFADLYLKIKIYLKNLLNKECIFDNNLSSPGFHIVYGDHKDSLLPLTSLHIDTPYELNRQYFLKKYSKVNFDFPISFTLTLKLPKSGGGLYYWDIYGWDKKREEDVHDLYINIYEKYDNLFKDKIPTREEYENVLNPKFLQYFTGGINIFKGNLLHQIAPFFSPLDKGENRITLQGHGIEAQDKWIIFF